MRTVLITGGAGFLGSALIRLAPAGWKVHATQRRTPAAGCEAHTVDLADAEPVARLWEDLRPDLVIHTAYDMHAGERDIVRATRNVADATRGTGAQLIHLSSDLVLDGEHSPYPDDAPPRPIHDYGRWKAEAEEYVRTVCPAAAVVRTSLITSFDPPDPRSAWVAEGIRGEAPLSLFVDELRCPIAVGDLARQLWEVAALDGGARAGLWNLVGPEAVSRYTLGVLIASALGLPAERIVPAWSREATGPRPRDLRLLTSRADRQLRTRARPIGALAARAKLAPSSPAG